MKQTASEKCHHLGCKEYGHFVYDTMKDYRAGIERRSKWLCTRHSSPERVLSSNNCMTTKQFINKVVMNKSSPNEVLGMFWDGHFGFLAGDGYKAFAKDFPEGTKLTITATVTFPSPEEKLCDECDGMTVLSTGEAGKGMSCHFCNGTGKPQ